jgi:sugar lactone lactonase YvrE
VWARAIFIGLLLGASALNAPAQSSEIARLEKLLEQNPRDAVVVYNLAAEYAATGNRERTLALLEKLPDLAGGLDPSVFRGFVFLHGVREFEALAKRIHQAHPPRVRSRPAFTIGESNLGPEGLAFDPQTRSLFAGSIQRKIIRIDARGNASDFVRVGEHGLGIVFGLRVDPVRRQLWAVSMDPKGFADLTGGTALFQFEIATGRLIAHFPGPPKMEGFLNDVVLEPASGVAYATNTSNGSIWRAVPGAATLEQFLPAGTVPDANGITISPDEGYLFVAGWHDIVRVDLQTRQVRVVANPTNLTDASMDGMYFYRNSLVGIQNGIHPARIARFWLDESLGAVTRSEILETYNPLFDGVTTGAMDGNSFLFFANTQSRKIQPDGSAKPGVELHPIVILRLKL